MFKVNSKLIRAMLADKGLFTIDSISKATKINNATVKRALLGQSVRFKTVGTFAKFFGVEVNELIVDAAQD